MNESVKSFYSDDVVCKRESRSSISSAFAEIEFIGELAEINNTEILEKIMRSKKPLSRTRGESLLVPCYLRASGAT